MAERIMAVYDVDPSYTDRFVEVVNKRGQAPFTVMAFTTMEKLKEYASGHKIELLLIGALTAKEDVDSIGAGQVVILSDGEFMADLQYPSIYKFQSTENIMREVMACYCARTVEPDFAVVGRTARIIGVYSPVNRCLKTSFALTVGQVLSRDSKTLYMNFEDCSGLARLMGEEHRADLSDLLYYYGQGSFNSIRLHASVYSWGELDYIPPVRYPEDLCQISAEDMASLIKRIARESAYEFLVVDLGQFGRKAAKFLDICDAIYMPVKEDSVSAAKIAEFEEYLLRAGKAELHSRIKKLKLPYHQEFGRKDNYLEQLQWGELGDYVRQLLRGSHETDR